MRTNGIASAMRFSVSATLCERKRRACCGGSCSDSGTSVKTRRRLGGDLHTFGGIPADPLPKHLRTLGLHQRCFNNFRKRQIRAGILPLLAASDKVAETPTRNVLG